jgi:phosphatidylglycerol:prolipoprotein diacylglycerol transferase
MGIWGGLMGGLVGLLAYSFVVTKKSSSKRIFNFQFSIFKLFLSMADVAVVGLPLGQAIGRLGNFFNQELYGLPTQLPWGLYIWPENRLAGYDSLERFHPLFAYEAVWNLLTFVIVITMIGKTRRTFVQPGLLFFVYLFLYGLGRFFLEFLRLNPWRLGMLTVAQWLGIISMGASLIFFGRIMRKDR